MSFIWIILSYIAGSIPFGYLIGRFSDKNVLEIGWKKTSGSNVFKNVGKWQGILTGLLDVAKGYLVVSGAQRLGFSAEVQVFSGLAAVVGHNWSVFLKFAGGRGIGTFAGVFLALSPQILLYSIIPLIVLGIIWNLAIGTILFLAVAIYLSYYFGQLQTAGLFTLLSLVPIFIKRLSPIREIKTSQNKSALIRNRLLFDNNEALFDLRIKRIIRKEKENPSRVTKIMKPLTLPIWLPTKFGWQIAKFGAKMAKKPIDKFILKKEEKIVLEIGIEDFKGMMIAASKKIVLHQEEINKINVFPVADKDTGYNLAATLLGVEGVISQKSYSDFRELNEDIKEAAMINARGNAGMIYTGYIIEFLDRIKHLETIDAFHFSLAMQRGIKAARSSVAEPVEGTILDVIRAAGEKALEVSKIKKEKNIIKVLEEAHRVSDIALKETKEKLQVLKENDVVDAGGLGFLKIIEAWIESLKGITINSKTEVTSPIVQPETGEKLKYRYEVVALFRKTPATNAEDLKKELSSLGDSLEVLESEDKIKFHIHTNSPESVSEKIRDFPEIELRVEDMESQMKKTEKKPLGLVIDEIADLPRDFLEKYGITEVPFTTRLPDGEFITSKEEIYKKMKEALNKGRSLPTTSAPSFKEYLSAYQKALEKFEKILIITVSSKLSGAYSSARIARSFYKKPAKLNLYVFDCFTAEVGEGLVVMKTQELISQGEKTEEIVEKLKEFCPKITLLGCINDFHYVVRGGRFKLPKILVKPVYFMQKLGIRLVVGLKNGRVKFFGINFGKDVSRILAEKIDLLRKGREIRAAIGYADNLKEAEKLKEELEKLPKIKVSFVSPVSPVVATHTGPGALLVAFYPVDN
ncbi:MAG: glycerol-3-phosphate acyltransferase [Candidatus Pacebacteria bacterium]|nr:glycerol-3-phosphate acyltransferase [Candidatus Paceibacterota bacterium]